MRYPTIRCVKPLPSKDPAEIASAWNTFTEFLTNFNKARSLAKDLCRMVEWEDFAPDFEDSIDDMDVKLLYTELERMFGRCPIENTGFEDAPSVRFG